MNKFLPVLTATILLSSAACFAMDGQEQDDLRASGAFAAYTPNDPLYNTGAETDSQGRLPGYPNYGNPLSDEEILG